MNNDLISRSALIERYGEPCHSFLDIIESMPAVDAIPMDFHERCLLLEVQKRHAVECERNAAVEQLRRADKENLLECTHCKHNVRCSEILLGCNGCDNSECPCNTCVDLSNWQWRGVQEVE
ncbi:MAG: hypothetical protein IJ466_11650 [Clostridia bacterium]|nr:hypothetical protein [Clostridia bacterium]